MCGTNARTKIPLQYAFRKWLNPFLLNYFRYQFKKEKREKKLKNIMGDKVQFTSICNKLYQIPLTFCYEYSLVIDNLFTVSIIYYIRAVLNYRC